MLEQTEYLVRICLTVLTVQSAFFPAIAIDFCLMETTILQIQVPRVKHARCNGTLVSEEEDPIEHVIELLMMTMWSEAIIERSKQTLN